MSSGPSRIRRAVLLILSAVAGVGYMLAVLLVIAAGVIAGLAWELGRRQQADTKRARVEVLE